MVIPEGCEPLAGECARQERHPLEGNGTTPTPAGVAAVSIEVFRIILNSGLAEYQGWHPFGMRFCLPFDSGGIATLNRRFIALNHSGSGYPLPRIGVTPPDPGAL